MMKALLGSTALASPPVITDAVAVWWATDLALSDGSAVSSWTDRVGGNIVTQGTSGNQPVFDVDGLNGRPSVNFDGSDDYLKLAAASPVSTSQDGCIVAVLLFPSTASGVIFETSASSGQALMAGSVETVQGMSTSQAAGGTTASTYVTVDSVSIGSPVVLEWSSNGSDVAMRANNAAKRFNLGYGTNSGDWFADITRAHFAIGADSRTVTSPLTGRLAYLGVFDSELSAGDRTRLYNWISSYYSMTNGYATLPANTVTDTFDRSNSTSTLGSTDGGTLSPLSWTAHSGTWGISSNLGYLVSTTAQAVASVDAAVANVELEADITLSAVRADTGLCFRLIDDNNYLVVILEKNATNNNIHLYKKDGGSFTLLATLGSAGNTLGSTYACKVVMDGDSIAVYRDNVLKLSHTLSGGNQTKFGVATRYGLRVNGTGGSTGDDGGTRFNNFAVTPLY